MRTGMLAVGLLVALSALAGCSKEAPRKDATPATDKTSDGKEAESPGNEKGFFERAGAATDSGVEKTKEVGAEAWDTTKEKTGEAWDKTKEVTGKAVDTTKEKAGEAWDATKEKTGEAVKKTREVTGEGLKKAGEWVAPDDETETK